MSSTWKAVSRNHPCPVCERTDWCGYTDDGAVRCMRVAESPGWRALSESPDGGVVFRRDDDNGSSSFSCRPTNTTPPPARLSNWDPVQVELFQEACKHRRQRGQLAKHLGVSDWHLVMLGIGWHKQYGCWTFPMHDSSLRVCGIRRRNLDGTKSAMKGSTDGVFTTRTHVSENEMGGPVVIAEGPTDAAALLAFGCSKVIGRSNCRGNVQTITAMVPGQDVVIIADEDEPGQLGAAQLSTHLQGIAKSTKIVTPPAKDIRQWLLEGATKDEFNELIAKDCNAKKQVQRSSS